MKGYAFALEVSPRQAFDMLRGKAVFPPASTWWFAWREDRIEVPSMLGSEDDAFGRQWDVLRVFAPLAELRVVRIGAKQVVSVFAEDDGLALLQPQGEVTQFAVAEEGRRILWGERMSLSGRRSRGVVAFPRELVYLEDDDPSKACTAVVVEYRDEEYMLRAVRYRELRLEAPKASDLRTVVGSADAGGR